MKKVISVLLTLLIPVAMGIYGYLGYYYALSQVDQTYVLFLIGGVLCISLFQLINQSVQWKKDGNISWNNTLLSLVLVAFMAINSCTYLNMLPFPVKETVPNFYNTSVNKVNEWAERHQIEITTIYECSDTIPMYNVMAQDVAEGTITETVSTMQIVLSEGPNYDKDVIVPQMLGYTLDEIMTYIQSHYMNNVEIRFEESPEERYIVIEQSNYGQMQRNDAITFTFSIGDKTTLPEQTMENLVGLSSFEATLWLNKSGIPYTITSEFSNDVDRNYVLSQSIAVNDPVNTQSKVELTISKGKEITVPDLTKMTVEEVTAWVIDNKLTISFQDQYDDKVELGGIIKTNLKENDIIEEETPVKVTTSKGPLRMEEFKTLSAFK
ncbi:MAG: PASTA domain-containing protein, partial [Erysipelotrichaceae bacterium]|nr:PASTA domain-containing protein [Erysipelotrichaceae bacterium]